MNPTWPTSFIGMLHPYGNEKQRFVWETVNLLAANSQLGYIKAKALIAKNYGRTTNAIETQKSLAEELGLLYVPYRSDRIVVTEFGKQLFGDSGGGKKATDEEVTRLLLWAMFRCQLHRPQSIGTAYPSISNWAKEQQDCSLFQVRPYATIWQILKNVDYHLEENEFMNEVRFIKETSEIPNAISRIRESRKAKVKGKAKRGGPSTTEGNVWIYWRSHFSIAEKLMTVDRASGIASLAQKYRDSVDSIISFNSPCSVAGETFSSSAAIPWDSVDDYYNKTAERCPVHVWDVSENVIVDNQSIPNISTSKLVMRGAKQFEITGPPNNLCRLKIPSLVYHADSQDRLLRVVSKHQEPNRMITVVLAEGRVILDHSKLSSLYGKS